ncbi:MAG TPA: hypothetical protein VNP96_07915 [Solirubrobacterales bacterium]|nr:hypothetical protein [Solirubrobacterales bacterium]
MIEICYRSTTFYYYNTQGVIHVFWLAGFLTGLIAGIIGLSVNPMNAVAVPTLGAYIEKDELSVSRSDERINYTVTVANVARVVSGAELTCNPTAWGGSSPTFSFQWLRNGVAIPGAEASTYGLQAADNGQVIQCRVTATNTVVDIGGGFAGSTRVASGFIVDPVPSAAPPMTAGTPTLTLSVGGSLNVGGDPSATAPPTTLTCATGLWRGEPTFNYQWYRNGIPLSGNGAATNTYAVQAADVATSATFQCAVKAANASGAATKVSANLATNPAPSPVAPSNNNTLSVSSMSETSTPISGVVNVEVHLPESESTFAYKIFNGTNEEIAPSGWTCSSQPPSGGLQAKVSCNRANALNPGALYPPIAIGTALGDDLPNVAIASATVSGGGAPLAASAFNEFTFTPPRLFDITAFETKVPNEGGVVEETQAGGHPLAARATFSFAKKRVLIPPSVLPGDRYAPMGRARLIATDTPRGFVGNALAVPELCSSMEVVLAQTCPSGSVVGGVTIDGFGTKIENMPIYAIEPEFGVPAQFAFPHKLSETVYTFTPRLRPEDGYAITLESAPALVNPALRDVQATICGFGATTGGPFNEFVSCKKATQIGANPVPLVTLPTRCAAEPPTTVLRVDAWENPGEFAVKEFEAPAVTGCDAVEFEPEIELTPTSVQADSPTGLDVSLTMPTDGLESPTGISQANLKRATVTLPAGMAVNAAAGHGLAACTATQVKMKTNNPIECPDGSKIGTIAIVTPLIQEKLTGSVYIAKQNDNPFDEMIGLYMVFESEKDGILIKIAGKVIPDPKTGQLVITFDDNPEAPFSSVDLHFAQGPRSPLLNPRRCGAYEIKAELTPWNAADPNNPTAEETVVQTSTFEVTEGPNGGSCPGGGLDPKLTTGSSNPVAGGHGSFLMTLKRDDGTQRFTALAVTVPTGLTADLRGIPYCPDAVLASIPTAEETGQAEIDNPSCPAASQIGTSSAGAGAGPDPFYVNTGKAYLAGPYKGAPLSLALVVPAVAGPLDLGNVVVRTALYINPKTAQITAVSDPIPTILHGILLDVRDIRVAIDRPNFIVNPTNCEPLSAGATVKGDEGATANVSSPFQVGNCAGLGFKPKVSLRLKGGTRRGDNPALTAVLTPRAGDANVARAAVTLPRSAFLDQAHIRTVCTRVQFAADQCPKAAIYGRAVAETPLLDQPLAGPVYLRSSSNQLPDLVADLRGPAHQPIQVEAAFRTDSIRGGIRSTLDLAPDAPVTKFTLKMQGGKKGLVVNSQNLCANVNRANVRLNAQNGRRFNSRPKVVATNCGKGRSGKRKGKRAR